MKRLQIPQKLVCEKFYVHEIAAINLRKIYFLKNTKKTCKPNNRGFNCDWKGYIAVLHRSTSQNRLIFDTLLPNIEIFTLFTHFSIFLATLMLDRTIDGLVILKRFGSHPSLDPNCYQKINQFKIDLKMIYPSLPVPLPNLRLVWYFKRANILSIRKAIKIVDWRFMFKNKNIHKQVSIFNNTLMNIFTNYIPNKYLY